MSRYPPEPSNEKRETDQELVKKKKEREREREMCSGADVNGRLDYHPRRRRHEGCLHCQPCRYIRLVQHLIEKCLTLQMNRQECVLALATHAGIRHSITATVWDELAKENPLFFHRYSESLILRQTLP